MKLGLLAASAASIALFGLAPAQASTSFDYVGPAYTSCVGGYVATCSTGNVTGTFTTSLSGAALDGLNDGGDYADITATIQSFSFSNGFGVTMTNLDTERFSFDLETDAGGAPISWAVFLDNEVSDPVTMGAGTTTVDLIGVFNSSDDGTFDTTIHCADLVGTHCAATDGASTGAAGTFSVSAGVPEPATWALSLLGFSGLGALMRRRRELAAG